MNKVSKYIKDHVKLVCAVLMVILVMSVILGVGIGPVTISFSEVWAIILNKAFGIGDISNIALNTQNIVWFLRTPRVLLGLMIGCCLSLSGVGMQTFTKNPLADPYILGISSGASCGAVISMLTPIFNFAGKYSIVIGAFVGAMVSIIIVYSLAKNGRDITPVKIILVGVAVSSLFSALTNYLVYNAPNEAKVKEATFWMLGSLASVKWEYLIAPSIIIIPSIIIMMCMSNSLNAMLMGDSTAINLGTNISLVRKVVITVTALLTAVAVSVSGCIGFVGLVIPHMVRAVVGSDHKKVIPIATLLGAIFLIWVDVGARMINAPTELPIGIITSVIGAPFFLWLIKVRKYSFGGQR